MATDAFSSGEVKRIDVDKRSKRQCKACDTEEWFDKNTKKNYPCFWCGEQTESVVHLVVKQYGVPYT